MRRAVDTAGGRYTADQLLANGITAFLFYIGKRGDWRMPPRSLIDSYTARGIECAAVYEEGDGSWALGGYQRGHQVGQNARSYLDDYGWGGACYGATDIDIVGSQLGTATEGYRGYRDGLGQREAGAYGGKLLLRAVRDALGYRLLWGTNARYWDHGVTIPVTLQQGGPASGLPNTDGNDVFDDYFGQWPTTAAPQTSGKDWLDMASEDDVRRIVREEIRAALADDSVKSDLALKTKQGLDGTLRLQAEQAGQPSPWRDGQDLLAIRDDINTVTLDQLDPNRQPPGPRPSPTAKPARDFLERIPEV